MLLMRPQTEEACTNNPYRKNKVLFFNLFPKEYSAV